MAGKSASKPMNNIPNKLGGELRGRPSVHSQDTQHLKFQIGISKYL